MFHVVEEAAPAVGVLCWTAANSPSIRACSIAGIDSRQGGVGPMKDEERIRGIAVPVRKLHRLG